MTPEERVDAIASFGFTQRQSRFLVTVMTHSGVCMGRQYCAFSGIGWGEPSRTLFLKLEGDGYATSLRPAHSRARLFHIHHKPMYAALGEVNTRLRRPTTLARAVERLMVLDAVTDDRSLTWLGTERDKVSHFTTRASVPRSALPSATFRSPGAESDRTPEETTRYFVDRLPIGVSGDGGAHVFLFVATEAHPSAFRLFLERHASLLRALPKWTVRVAFPRHRAAAIPRYESAFRDQLLTPLPPRVLEELRWYVAEKSTAVPRLDERFFLAQSAFETARFRALLKRWTEDGEAVLDSMTSEMLKEAVTTGRGRLECVVLPHQYLHLLSLVGTA